jgi:hypothetical protein
MRFNTFVTLPASNGSRLIRASELAFNLVVPCKEFLNGNGLC